MSESREAAPQTQRRSSKAIVIGLAVVALILAADLYTKSWALENLSGRILNQPDRVCQVDRFGRIENRRAATRPHVIVPGFFELRYAENCGAAFGFMNRWSPLAKKLVFFPVALGAVLFLGYMFVAGRGGRLLAAAVPLIIAGALGNFHDRLVHGYVIDFIRFYGETPQWLQFDVRILWLRLSLGPTWEYPTFNVADIAITLGVVFLLIDGFTANRRLAREESESGGGRVGGVGHGASAPGESDAGSPAPALYAGEMAEGGSAAHGSGHSGEGPAADEVVSDPSAEAVEPDDSSEDREETARAHAGPSHGYLPLDEAAQKDASAAGGAPPAERSPEGDEGPSTKSESAPPTTTTPSESPPSSERGQKPTAGA